MLKKSLNQGEINESLHKLRGLITKVSEGRRSSVAKKEMKLVIALNDCWG